MAPAMPDRIKLAVEDVSKTFRVRGEPGEKDTLLAVLRHVSFVVGENEIVSLVGESGCGKTTLLRIVQGLVRLDRGTIRIDGRVAPGPGRDRGFVFPQPNPLPGRTAPSKFPHQLSVGMQQRIGLPRALAIDPAVLLMDEPFSALDAQTREILQKELLRIHAETGKTILFVTHDLDEAIYLSDRVIVMGAKPGRIKATLPVPFPRPRAELPLLRGEPAFQKMRTQMWEL